MHVAYAASDDFVVWKVLYGKRSLAPQQRQPLGSLGRLNEYLCKDRYHRQ